MKTWLRKLAAALTLTAGCSIASAQDYTDCYADATAETFNGYIACAVRMLGEERTGGGYNIRRAFSRDVPYGPDDEVIRATRKSGVVNGRDYGPAYDPSAVNPSMCVAGVSEVLIEAINFYAAANGPEIYEKAPSRLWNGGAMNSLRANIFEFEGAGSNGSAHAMKRFGMGREKLFSELNPYDLVKFSRTTGSGHSVIFIEYIDRTGRTSEYSEDVIGFRYFSVQGQGRPDGGFGYRDAYFHGKCPSPRGRNDDCNVIFAFYPNKQDPIDRQKQNFLNTGEVFAPSRWEIQEALDLQIATFLERSPSLMRGRTRGEALRAAERIFNDPDQLSFDPSKWVDGSEDD